VVWQGTAGNRCPYADQADFSGPIGIGTWWAEHSNAKITGLNDRREDEISVGEVERIAIRV